MENVTYNNGRFWKNNQVQHPPKDFIITQKTIQNCAGIDDHAPLAFGKQAKLKIPTNVDLKYMDIRRWIKKHNDFVTLKQINILSLDKQSRIAMVSIDHPSTSPWG